MLRLPVTAHVTGLCLRLVDVGTPAQIEPLRAHEHAVVVRDAPGDASDSSDEWVGMTVIEKDGSLSRYSLNGMFALAALEKLAALERSRSASRGIIPVARHTRRLTSAAAIIDTAVLYPTISIAVYTTGQGNYYIGGPEGIGDQHKVQWCPRPQDLSISRPKPCDHTYVWTDDQSSRTLHAATWSRSARSFVPCSGRGAVAAAVHACCTMEHNGSVSLHYTNGAKYDIVVRSDGARSWFVTCAYIGDIKFDTFS